LVAIERADAKNKDKQLFGKEAFIEEGAATSLLFCIS